MSYLVVSFWLLASRVPWIMVLIAILADNMKRSIQRVREQRFNDLITITALTELLSIARKIEHPKEKQIAIRLMEEIDNFANSYSTHPTSDILLAFRDSMTEGRWENYTSEQYSRVTSLLKVCFSEAVNADKGVRALEAYGFDISISFVESDLFKEPK